MLLLQNILYCLLFILMVKCLVRNDGMNCVYFYPNHKVIFDYLFKSSYMPV